VFIAQREYAIFVSALLSGYLRLFHEVSVNKTTGFGTFPFIIDVVRSVLNDDEKKIGISAVGQTVTVLVPLLVLAYVCLNDMDVANTVMKVVGVYDMVKAVLYVLFPKELGKAWGFAESTSEDETVIATVRAAWEECRRYAVSGTTAVALAANAITRRRLTFSCARRMALR
jgi:hypothetical protein